MAVDDAGSSVPGDLLLATFATDVAGPGDRVAAPVDTSLVVDDALEAAGASLVRTRVGDVHVAERATEAGVVFGGEPSGAWIFPAETLCPDGPLAAVRLSALAAERPLSERVAGFDPYPIRRTNHRTDRTAAVVDAVREACAGSGESVSTLDGVRVSRDDGWFLVRASGTQPLVRVTAEARDPAAADDLLATAEGLVTAAIERTGE